MTKRQALLRPHSVALSDSKKSTRPPSPKRLSEAEAMARLMKRLQNVAFQ